MIYKILYDSEKYICNNVHLIVNLNMVYPRRVVRSLTFIIDFGKFYLKYKMHTTPSVIKRRIIRKGGIVSPSAKIRQLRFIPEKFRPHCIMRFYIHLI
jgi:hypothetical protein